MNSNGTKLLAILGIPVFGALIIVPIGLIRSWVLQKLYVWLALPLGAPDLNIWHVWGLSMLISLLTQRPDTNKSEEKKDYAVSIIGNILGMLVILLMAYFIKGNI